MDTAAVSAERASRSTNEARRVLAGGNVRAGWARRDRSAHNPLRARTARGHAWVVPAAVGNRCGHSFHCEATVPEDNTLR